MSKIEPQEEARMKTPRTPVPDYPTALLMLLSNQSIIRPGQTFGNPGWRSQ